MKGSKKSGAAKAAPDSDSPPNNLAEEVRKRVRALTSSITVPDPLAIRNLGVISTGFLLLDALLKIGGMPKGRVNTVEGAPGSGKTALIGAIIGAHQIADPHSVHAFIDVEGTASIPFFEILSVNTNPSRFIYFKPGSAEEACEIAMYCMGFEMDKKKHAWIRDPQLPNLATVTYDSWAGSPTDTVGMSPLARVGSEWWPQLANKASRTGTTIYAINQLREKPGVSFGDPRYGPGGHTFEHAQSIRLWVTASNTLKDPETKAKLGHDLRVEIRKSKVATHAPPVTLHLSYATGFDYLADALSYSELRGRSFKSKAKGESNVYVFGFKEKDDDEEVQIVKENGREAFLDAIREYPDAHEAFIKQAREIAASNLFSNDEESHNVQSPQGFEG